MCIHVYKPFLCHTAQEMITFCTTSMVTSHCNVMKNITYTTVTLLNVVKNMYSHFFSPLSGYMLFILAYIRKVPYHIDNKYNLITGTYQADNKIGPRCSWLGMWRQVAKGLAHSSTHLTHHLTQTWIFGECLKWMTHKASSECERKFFVCGSVQLHHHLSPNGFDASCFSCTYPGSPLHLFHSFRISTSIVFICSFLFVVQQQLQHTTDLHNYIQAIDQSQSHAHKHKCLHILARTHTHTQTRLMHTSWLLSLLEQSSTWRQYNTSVRRRKPHRPQEQRDVEVHLLLLWWSTSYNTCRRWGTTCYPGTSAGGQGPPAILEHLQKVKDHLLSWITCRRLGTNLYQNTCRSLGTNCYPEIPAGGYGPMLNQITCRKLGTNCYPETPAGG